MIPLHIEKQDDTPEIRLDKINGTFSFEGKSLPEDVIEFYDPVFNWLQEYIGDPNEETIVNMKMEYFNSASFRAVNEILDQFTELSHKGFKVVINWYYFKDDADMYDTGIEFRELTGLDFVFKIYNL